MNSGRSGAIVGRRFFSGDAEGVDIGIAFVDGTIDYCGKSHQVARNPVTPWLPDDYVLAPGFIDVQVNGGGGVLLNAAPTLGSIETIVAAHRRGGTTGLLPTLITDTPETLDALIAIAPAAFKLPGVLGLHLEGPFIALEKRGVHRAELVRRPRIEDINKLKALATHGRVLVTLAPEVFTQAQLRELVSAGLILSAGHSIASYEVMRDAADAGLTGVTHLYNAVEPLTARAPGVIGAALDDARLFVGVIADGHHVADANLRLVVKAKSAAAVMLVTDAMATAASDVTTFDLQGQRITKSGGRLVTDNGTLAGAHLTMIEAVRHMTSVSPGGWRDAIVMASLTPARFLGLDATHGILRPGRRADLVAFHNETLDVLDTWIGGHAMPGDKAPSDHGVTT